MQKQERGVETNRGTYVVGYRYCQTRLFEKLKTIVVIF